ncbi:MAG: sulfatase-like hydrolase/transferase [Gemmatimonadaceae bacterium]|nr:sulfatase-like hydrolase/transferase [Gemmatimonadaceae bacterium]
MSDPSITGPASGSAARSARGSAVSRLLAAALVAGPWTGWLHTIELAVERQGLGHFTWYSREFIWMSPIAYTLFFLAVSVPVLVVAMLAPRIARVEVAAGWVALLGVFGLLLPYPEVGRLAALILAFGVAVQVWRMVQRYAPWWRRVTPWVVLTNLALIGAIAVLQPLARRAGERRVTAALPAAPAGAPNVLLIILDTVRAASLSLYGFPYPTSPHLSALATGGVTFDQAYAPAPWTLPSHASYLTGRWPFELTADWTVPLDGKTPVITEAFRARGYHTAAIVANHDYTAFDSGLARGFTHFEDYLVSWPQLIHSTSYTQTAAVRRVMNADELSDLFKAVRTLDLSIDPKHHGDERRAGSVTGAFLDWQRAHGDRPFFAMLNYFDAHLGYYAPPGFPRIESPRAGRYHTAISWIDANLDRLFTELGARGVLDNTVVIVTSDHGELFNEHGLSGHANNLYRNVLHVPLVVRYPARVPAGVRVPWPISLRDLAATIADLAALPGSVVPGTSLRAAWEGDTTRLSPVLAHVSRAPNVDASFPTARGDLTTLIDDERHYIRNFGGGEELFAWRRDSLELSDLATTSPAERASYRARLERLTGRR